MKKYIFLLLLFFQSIVLCSLDNEPILVTPFVDKLRLRESEGNKGKFIRFMKKWETLELIDRGKLEVIDGDKGSWVKVKTKDNVIGWCFGAYLSVILFLEELNTQITFPLTNKLPLNLDGIILKKDFNLKYRLYNAILSEINISTDKTLPYASEIEDYYEYRNSSKELYKKQKDIFYDNNSKKYWDNSKKYYLDAFQKINGRNYFITFSYVGNKDAYVRYSTFIEEFKIDMFIWLGHHSNFANEAEIRKIINNLNKVMSKLTLTQKGLINREKFFKDVKVIHKNNKKRIMTRWDIENTESENYFSFSDSNIVDIKGLEEFSKLQFRVYAYGSQLTAKHFNNLKNLKELTLGGDNSDLKFLDNLYIPNLEELTIKDSNFSGFGYNVSLPKLKKLTIENTQIKTILDNATFPNLETIVIKKSNFEKIGKNIRLPKLTSLCISESKIVDVSYFSDFINLLKLDLSHNAISEINGLDSLVKLKELILSNNKIEEIKKLYKNTDLQYLDLSSNNINEIQHLDRNQKLKELILDNNQIKNFMPSKIRNVENLSLKNNLLEEVDFSEGEMKIKKLDLSNNKIKKIISLSAFQDLKVLNLSANMIEKLENFEKLYYLEKIILENNKIATLKGFKTYSGSFNEVRLFGNPISDEEVELLDKEYIRIKFSKKRKY